MRSSSLRFRPDPPKVGSDLQLATEEEIKGREGNMDHRWATREPSCDRTLAQSKVNQIQVKWANPKLGPKPKAKEATFSSLCIGRPTFGPGPFASQIHWIINFLRFGPSMWTFRPEAQSWQDWISSKCKSGRHHFNFAHLDLIAHQSINSKHFPSCLHTSLHLARWLQVSDSMC
mgnify:CR=1 FL=1